MNPLRILTILIFTNQCIAASAQIGFTLGPYFITPNFGSICYGQEGKVGNNQSIGGYFNLNIAKKFNISYSHLEFFSDRYGSGSTPRLGYGVGAQPVFDYVPIKNTDLQFSFTLKYKELYKTNDWLGGKPIGKAIGVRAGLHNSQRLLQLKPQKVNFIGPDNNGIQTAQYDFVSWYDITGVKQLMASAGFSIDKYKTVEQYRNPFNRLEEKNRNRVYQQYIEVLYAYSQKYNDYGTDSFRFSGEAIPDISNFGWRAGFRRVTYNNLGHSFIFEFGQYPGQRRKPEEGPGGIPADENYWKNWFVFVGFHISIGHWFGDYE